MLAMLTGLRMGDLLGLRRSDVGPEGISVNQSKTKGRLLIEWTPELRAAVDDCRTLDRSVGSVYLLPNRRGQRYTVSGFGCLWARARDAAGADWTFQDLRAKSGSDHETGEHLGHADARTRERVYRRRPRRVRPANIRQLSKTPGGDGG